MALPSFAETSQDVPEPPDLRALASPGPEKATGLLGWLDFFLSEPLRNAPPEDLVRHRVLVGSACFMIMLAMLFVVSTFFSPYSPIPGLAGVLYGATLVAARKATRFAVPAGILLATLTASFLGAVLSNKANLEGGVHAMLLLLPAFAVYLLGPRRALFYTLFLAVFLDALHPLYITLHLGSTDASFSLSRFWVRHLMAGFAFLGIWGLSSLHSTARDAAHHSLEQALKQLRVNESKLISIIESTDDVVVSLDTEGRLLVANSAMKQFYQGMLGRKIELGQSLFRGTNPENAQPWKDRLAQVLRGQRLRHEETYDFGGSRRVMDVCMHPILGEGGQVVGVTLFSRDITSRKEAEARLGEMHR
ncbi:PAS domain-containing protein, partial [Archangium sp.]|uniref:PAS domain-containing protein n=1 Tax=Archangium sp. TaxID=1872627 RepID=UPI002EDB53DE